ncbi:MAG TPA: hypothetical protein VH083_07100 [Myxococcales bacterium]|jgi:hypothetical protein|nr:hypothetical protein [Myxococcales bacterium]
MRWLLLSRWARSLAIVGVYLLALQSLGLPRFAVDPDDCCCHARSASCHCKFCTHVRELESNTPLLQSCGATNAPVAIIAVDPALPAVEPLPQPRLAALPPREAPPRIVQSPPREVPTPPPLA